MQWKSAIWKWLAPLVIKGCIYYSHKIKEISKGRIITLDLQLRYQGMCHSCKSSAFFPRVYLSIESRSVPGGHFIFLLLETNSAKSLSDEEAYEKEETETERDK